MKKESATKIYIASDHGGFELKGEISAFIEKMGYDAEDLGPHTYNKEDDYPDYAEKLCKKMMGTQNKGILICGSGQGMERTANKFPGIYASVCWNEETAKIAKEHGNINVLCLAGKVTNPAVAKKIVKIWLESPFSNEERHVRRLEKLRSIEKKYMR